MKLNTKAVSAALAGLALVATAVWATVTFNPSTGSGFVGKGDVCTALSISPCKNPTGSLYFIYTNNAQYTQDCVKENVHQTISKTFQRRRNVSYTWSGTIRNQGKNASSTSSQNEGYILTGWAGDLNPPFLGTDGYPIIPPTGNLCPPDWTAAGPVIANGTGSNLAVSWTTSGGVVIWVGQ